MKLDAKTIAALKLGDKTDAIYFDDSMAGFGYRLRMGAGGKVMASWIAQYKQSGATRRIRIGPSPLIGLDAARAAAKKILGKVALGEDPQADRSDRRGKDALTMRTQVLEFLAHKQAELAPRTYVETKRYLSDPKYFGTLHSQPVDQIHRKDIATCTIRIVRECGSPTAARARGALGGFFTWTMRMGLTESNPTIGAIAPSAGNGRKRVLLDPELASIWKSCGDDEYGKIIRLLILTACRRAEIGDCAWPEFDLNNGTFTIPEERSKNGIAHTLPLMPMMRDIIDTVPHMVHRPQLFGVHAKGFTAYAKCKVKLDADSGISRWVVHDIRRTVASRMGDLGVLPHVIEAILNHQSGHKAGTAGIYNKSPYWNDVRAALALWHDHVASLVAGSERKVLPYRAAVAT
jgi:integrase